MTMTDISTRFYTIDEYFAIDEQLPERHEFNNGKITKMAGATNPHVEIAGNFYFYLKSTIKDQNLAYKAYSEGVRIILPTSNRVLYGDTCVAAKPVKEFVRNEKKQGILNPCVIVEVLSKSTAAKDRGEKFRSYKTIPEFQEYILVEQNSPVIDVILKTEKKWEISTYEGLDSIAKIETLGIEIPLADIYEDIDFTTKEEEETTSITP